MGTSHFLFESVSMGGHSSKKRVVPVSLDELIRQQKKKEKRPRVSRTKVRRRNTEFSRVRRSGSMPNVSPRRCESEFFRVRQSGSMGSMSDISQKRYIGSPLTVYWRLRNLRNAIKAIGGITVKQHECCLETSKVVYTITNLGKTPREDVNTHIEKVAKKCCFNVDINRDEISFTWKS